MAPFVLGISGSSCAGKTTLAEKLCRAICGPGQVQVPRRSKKVRASRFEAASGVPRVSVVCQDSFFKGVPADAEHLPWDEPESLDHDLVLSVLKAEAEDQTLDCLIFEGFKAFHDERVVALLQMYVWLQVPRDVAQKRRMARCSGCSEQHFDQQIWANHMLYQQQTFERLGSKLSKFSGEHRATDECVVAMIKLHSEVASSHYFSGALLLRSQICN